MTRPFAAIALFFLLTIGAALGSSGCGSSSPSLAAGSSAPTPVATPAATPAAATPATFTQINSGILQPSCVQCHGSASGSGGINLGSYAGVMAQVSAGNPSTSALYNAVANGIMPPTGALPQSQVQEIQGWIAAGAPGN